MKHSNPDLESWVSAAMETPLRAHYIRRGIDLTLITEGGNAPGREDVFASQATRLQDTLAREQRAREERDSLREERDILREERDSLREERDILRGLERKSGKRVTQFEEEVEQLKITRFEAKCECYVMKTSFSCKLTWPFAFCAT